MSDYTPSGNPLSLVRGVAALIRAEFQAIATAISSKGNSAGQTWTGAHDFTGGSVAVVTASVSDSSSKAASTLYVDRAVTTGFLNGTSASSLTVGTGSKTLVTQPGRSLVVGMSVKIAMTTSPTNWMHGDITAYNGTTGDLTILSTSINGSGSAASWTISLSGPGDVTLSGVQSVSNKKLDSTTTRITDTTDPSKTVVFDLSNLASGTTASILFPSAGGMLGGDMVLVSTASIVASAAAVSIPLPTAYNDVVIEVSNLYANSAQMLYGRINNSTANIYDEAGYVQRTNSASSPSHLDRGRYAFSGVELDGDSVMLGADKDHAMSVNITLNNINSTTEHKYFKTSSWGRQNDAGQAVVLSEMACVWRSSAAITAFNLVPYACLLMGGKYKVWGKKG